MLKYSNMDVKWSTKSLFLFLTVICFILSVLTITPYAMAEPDAYSTAKVELQRLLEDEKRSEYRHNWISLSDDFYEVYRKNANWNNRPASLFRAALCLDKMARRSYVRKDAQSAASLYESLAKKHPISPLADDSLFAAAQIYQELLHNTTKAKALLNDINKRYAKSDYAPRAKNYLASLNGDVVASLDLTSISAPPKKANLALNHITPQLRNKEVRIVLSLSSMSSWRAKYFEHAIDKKPGVVITLKDVAPSERMSLEDQFSKSGIFKAYSVEYNPATAQSTIILQFSDLACYAVKAEKQPARIIIEASNVRSSMPNAISVGDGKPKTKPSPKAQAPRKPAPQAKATKPKESKKMTVEDMPHIEKNVAAQLGLEVKTIVIDPGHGGKDPGAIHNGIKEKDINLDVSKRLANVLRASGYTVHLTRTTDVFLGLYERTDIAKKLKADLFISIHANASKKTSVSGFETYFLDISADDDVSRLLAVENAGVPKKGLGEMQEILVNMAIQARIQESKILAAMVQRNALRKSSRNKFAVHNGGVRGAPFHVLIGSTMPGVLVEIGYSSNPQEAKRLKTEKYKNTIAEGIANGIHEYATKLLQASK